ncbi:MAG: acyl-[acyl-carrier-protein] thioesterase [Lachnospiraceae bacterium]|nr:acyl-[acyl-carrier-protein] thioesterase [Lachnospiraceae bacterium]
MYTYQSRVGFSQSDVNQNMSVTSIIDVFQDCSCFHSDDLGVGFYKLHPMNYAWVINYWEVEFLKFPKYSDRIEVGTFPYEFKGFMGCRNFFIRDMEGNFLVKANSIWAFMDWEKMLPVRVPKEISDKYESEEKLDMTYSPRKIRLPEGDDVKVSEKDKVIIQRSHLDGNGHVNNGQYIKIALEQISLSGDMNRLRVEYQSQAHLGDEIHPFIYEKDNKITVALNNSESHPFAIVEVTV